MGENCSKSFQEQSIHEESDSVNSLHFTDIREVPKNDSINKKGKNTCTTIGKRNNWMGNSYRSSPLKNNQHGDSDEESFIKSELLDDPYVDSSEVAKDKEFAIEKSEDIDEESIKLRQMEVHFRKQISSSEYELIDQSLNFTVMKMGSRLAEETLSKLSPPMPPKELDRPIGPIEFNGDVSYTGTIKNNLRHGHGIQKKEVGYIYIGEFKEDKITGYGLYIEDNGNHYLGYLSNGVFSGDGEYTNIEENSTIKGCFKGGTLSGEGTKVYGNGLVYKGSFQNNLEDGIGILEFPEGSRIEGTYIKGRLCGQGIWKRPQKGLYIGGLIEKEIKKNIWEIVREGEGMEQRLNGDIYNGNFVNSKWNGWGSVEWNDGTKWTGNWLNGKQHGEGIYVHGDVERHGVWDNGKRIKWI